MRKVYEHVGALPVCVTGVGWVRPGTTIVCEMLESEESWFSRIGAIKVVRDADDSDTDTAPGVETSHAPEEWTRQERARLTRERQARRGRR